MSDISGDKPHYCVIYFFFQLTTSPLLNLCPTFIPSTMFKRSKRDQRAGKRPPALEYEQVSSSTRPTTPQPGTLASKSYKELPTLVFPNIHVNTCKRYMKQLDDEYDVSRFIHLPVGVDVKLTEADLSLNCIRFLMFLMAKQFTLEFMSHKQQQEHLPLRGGTIFKKVFHLEFLFGDVNTYVADTTVKTFGSEDITYGTFCLCKPETHLGTERFHDFVRHWESALYLMRLCYGEPFSFNSYPMEYTGISDEEKKQIKDYKAELGGKSFFYMGRYEGDNDPGILQANTINDISDITRGKEDPLKVQVKLKAKSFVNRPSKKATSSLVFYSSEDVGVISSTATVLTLDTFQDEIKSFI